jgi:AraC-like DNA-binding protein
MTVSPRSLQVAGFATPKRLIVAAKLLRAYLYLRDPGQTVAAISAKLRYRDPKIFSEHTHEVLGLSPSKLRTQLDATNCQTLLFDWVRRDQPRFGLASNQKDSRSTRSAEFS